MWLLTENNVLINLKNCNYLMVERENYQCNGVVKFIENGPIYLKVYFNEETIIVLSSKNMDFVWESLSHIEEYISESIEICDINNFIMNYNKN